jgi:histidinol-phosphatase (PHP family)
LFDNHVHTFYSADSSADPADIIRSARTAGLSGIVFTDHWDAGYRSVNERTFVPKDYLRGGIRAYRRSAEDFSVLLGIEAAPIFDVLDEARQVLGGADFDFVILSAHYVENIPQCEFGVFCAEHGKTEAYRRYLLTLLRLIRAYDDFDVLGHFDYISRYTPFRDPVMYYRDFADIFDELFRYLIERRKGLELNTATGRKIGGPVPIDPDIVKRYRELGGELICVGSDAHRAQDVGSRFALFREILLAAGFRRVVHFERRKPVFEDLNS